jgi:hypothetical protein
MSSQLAGEKPELAMPRRASAVPRHEREMHSLKAIGSVFAAAKCSRRPRLVFRIAAGAADLNLVAIETISTPAITTPSCHIFFIDTHTHR